jgi:heme-degrading monooxygenase HmoA
MSMYARIAQFKAVTGKKAELVKGYRDSMALLSSQKGFKQAVLMVDPDGDNVISVTLWESKEDLKNTEKPGAYMDHALPYISAFQQARPNFQHYEVFVNDAKE